MASQMRLARRSGAKQIIALAATAAAVLASGLSAPTANAAPTTLDWTGSGGGGLWSNSLNWTPDPSNTGANTTPGDGDIAVFNKNSASTNITVGNISLNSLVFSDSTSYTLLSGTLTLDNGGGVNVQASSTGSQTLDTSLAIILGTDTGSDSFTINNSTTSGFLTALNVNGSITGNAAAGNVDTLNLTGTGQITLGGIIGDGASGGKLALVQSSTGTTFLAGANTFTGGLSVLAGTLIGNSANAFGANSNTIVLGSGTSNANLLVGTTGLTFANPIVLGFGATGTLTVGNTNGASTTFTGGVTGASNLTIADTGSGTVTFSSGSLNNGGNITNTGTSTGGTIINSIIGSNVGIVTQNSTTATLTLAGANTFTGGLQVLAGTVIGTTSTSAFGPNAVTLGNTSGTANAAILEGTTGLTIANPIILATGSAGVLSIGNANGIAAATFTGGVTGTNNLTLADSGTGTLTFSTGSLANTGTISNAGTGTGTTTISAPVGSTVISIIEASNTSPLTVSGAITPGSTTFNSTGTALFTLSTASITGSGNITFNANSTGNIAATAAAMNPTGLIINSGTGSGTTTISGVIGAAVTGVNQTGAGTLSITGTTNTFTGNIIDSGGTLSVPGGNGNGTSAPMGIVTGGTAFKTVTLTNNAILNFTSSYNSNVPSAAAPGNGVVVVIGATGGTLNTPTGVVLTLDDGTGTGTATTAAELQGTGTLTKTGVGTLNLGNGTSNFSNFTGAIVVSAGTLQIGALTAADSPLGATSAGTTISGTGAALDINGQSSANIGAEPLTINGSGITIAGALTNTSATAGSFSGPITLGSAATIGSSAAGGITVSGGIGGTGNLTFTNTSTGGVTVSTGAITSVGTLTNSGTGTGTTTINVALGSSISSVTENGTSPLTLTVAGLTYAGQTTITAGTLNANAAGALGTGPILVNGGTLSQTGVINGAAQTLTVTSGIANLSQANTYAGGTTLSGTGIINLTAANSLPAGLTMTGGTLSSTAAAAANANPITINGGLLTTGATGTFGAVIGGTSAHTINPGGVGTFGTMTLASLATSAATTLQFDEINPWVGTPANTGDLLVVTGSGGLTVNASTLFNFNGALSNDGDYRLIQYTGTAPTLNNSMLPAPRAGLTYAFDTTSDPGFIDLLVSGAPSMNTSTWIPTAAGTFSWNTSGNWTGGIPSTGGDAAMFGTLAGSETVTLDAVQHVGVLTLNPTGTANTYTITAGSAGALVLDNLAAAAQVNNTTGNNTISAPVTLLSTNSIFNMGAGTNLTLSGLITGPGKLTVSGGTGSLTLSNSSNAYTGGTEIDSGTLIDSVSAGTGRELNNLGVGITTLNGGTLSFSTTAGQTTPVAGFVVNVGASGGTLNVAGAGTAGKLLMGNFGQFTGSGTLTKTGGGDLQISAASLGFTGNVNINGLIEDQNIAALGGGGATPTGIFTINSAGELVISGTVQVFQATTLAGGILSANGGTNNGILNSTLNVTASSTLAARLFQTPTTSNNLAINTLTGSGSLSVIGGSTTTAVQGLVTIGNASGYTGTITVGTNGAIGIGDSTAANFFGSSNAINVSTVSSAVGLIADGDGTSTPQTLSFKLPTNPINFVAGNTGGYMVGKQGATTIFDTEANKTISIVGALPYNNTNLLTVTPFNGYGLLLTAQPSMAAITTFNVGGTSATAQASNVIPGLTLQNLASTGATGIVKTGTGTLLLSGTSNTFGGAGALIDIQGGTVAAASDGAGVLGNTSNTIKLDNTTLAEFLAEGTFSTNRTITIGLATGNTMGVTSGNTLTLSTGLAYLAAGNTLTKVEDGTLVLAASATGGPSSATAINAGALKPINSGAIGNGTITLANTIGASLQFDTTTLNGGNATPTTFTQGLSLSNYGIQGRGAVENVTGNNAISTGTITVANATAIGVDAGSSLTISSPWAGTALLNLVGGGTGTISSVLPANTVLVYAPGGTWNLTAADTAITATTIDGGTLSFNGAGTNGNAGVAINYGGIVSYDNTITTNVANRSAGHTQTLTNGTVQLLGANNATSTETFLGINFGRGEDVINAVANGTGQANITLTNTGGAFTHQVLSSAVFEGTGLGTGDAAGAGFGSINIGVVATTFQGAGTGLATNTAPSLNHGILPWAIAINTTTGATTFATADATTSAVIRNLNAFESIGTFGAVGSATFGGATVTTQGSTTVLDSNTTGLMIGQTVYGPGIPAGATITAISANTSFTLSSAATTSTSEPVSFLSTADNITLGGASTLPGSLPSNGLAVNSLTLGTSGSLTLTGAPQVVTLGGAQGGGLLALGAANTISGGIITAGANELDIHTVGNLTVSANITGGAGTSNVGLTKGESGTLTLNATAFYVGQTVVNAGTLNLNVGNNTIQYTNYMELGAGATLQLNGNSQIVTDLFSDSASIGTGLGTVGNVGIVTGTTGAVLIVNEDSARTFTGSIQGAVSYVHSATAAAAVSTLTQNNTYTGVTLINGGGVILNGLGQFSATTSLTINQASLTFDNNTGSQDMATRVPSGLGITLGGGTLSYIGRTQFASAETVGVVSATLGANAINSTVQTTGVASAALTLTGLNRTPGATVNFTNTNGTLGTIGTNPTIVINGMASTAFMGGGYIVNGTDFAGYNATYGVGALGTTGFAGYSPAFLNFAAPGDNISMAASTNININNQTINSLRITGTTAINFNPSQTLTLTSGGLLLNGSLTLGSAMNSGTLTTTNSELFIYANSGTSLINSAITGAGVTLVKSGAATTVTLAGTNTYGGGTYIDQGTITLSNAGNATVGQTSLGTGGIFLNGGTLTQTVGSVIPSQAVSVTGNGVLTLNASLAISSTTIANSNVLTVASTNGIAVGQPVSGTGIPNGEFVTGINTANNTVTITTGAGVTAGTNSLTYLVNNTLTGITFNNTGGSTAPNVTGNGLLTLTGNITASSLNVGSTSVLGGTISLANQASPTITVNPILIGANTSSVAPVAPVLNISAALQNSVNPISVTGGGVLEVSGQSNFTGGVNLAAGTSLLFGASTANTGATLTGPVGNGTLTVGSGSGLLTTGTFTINNNINVAPTAIGSGGNVKFDIFEGNGAATAATLTLGSIGGIGNVTLPNGVSSAAVANTNFNVNAPQMTVAVSGNIVGTNAAITKNGPGVLALNGNNSFDSGVTLNNGTLLVTSLTGLGSGPVAMNGGQLSIHANGNGSASNTVLNFGNNVVINSSLASAFIDVNNNGANTGNTILMGSLNYTGATTPATVLNVTGGNTYGLRFQSTNLTTIATAPVDFNVGLGVTLTLPGSGFTLANLPVNIGPGTLVLSGSTVNTTPVNISGTQLLNPVANGTGFQLNTSGALALGAGSTLQISPIVNTSSNPLTNTGYTAGGLQGKYVNFTGTGNAIISAAASSIPGAAVIPGLSPSDSSFNFRPNLVANAGTFADSMAYYNGLLKINTGGTYTFQGGSDDSMQLVIDGVTVFQQLDTSSAGQAVAVGTPITVNLSAGYHSITMKGSNLGSGGGMFLLYGGPDTGAPGNSGGLMTTGGATPPLQSIPLSNLAYINAPTGATLSASAFENAAQISNAVTLANNTSATIDGLGADLNSSVASLTLGGGTSVLTINNTGGQGTIGVLGATGITAAGQTITTATGTLYLIGGVNDQVSGVGVGFTKAGAGTLVLGGSTAGSFTGNLNVTAGFLQVADPAALPTGNGFTIIASGATLDLNGTQNVAGNITLNGIGFAKFTSANEAGSLYNSNVVAASTTGAITIGIAATSIGGYGNINMQGTLTDGGLAWSKVGPNMLTLSGANNTSLTGTVTVANGILQAGSVNAFGNTAATGLGITVNGNVGALDLNGLTLAGGRTVAFSGAGILNAGGVSTTSGFGSYTNTLGGIFNSSASPASYAGTVVMGAAGSVGNNLLTGNTASASVPVAAVTPGASTGDITFSNVVSGAFVLTKVGGDNLFLTNGANTFTGFTVNEGTIVMNGNGAFVAAANTNTISAGGSLVLDNVGTAVNSRLGSRGNFVAGYLTILGNSSTAVTETIGSAASGNNLNAIYGQSVVTLNAQAGAPLTLNFTGTSTQPVSQSGTNLGTMEIIGTSLGSASANGVAAVTDNAAAFGGTGQNGGNNVVNQGIISSTLAINSTTGTAGFASMTATTAGLMQPLSVFGGIATLTAADNVFASSALTAPTTGVTSINSLTLASGGSLTIGAGNTITLQSGGLLTGTSTTATGVNASISGAGTLSSNTVNNTLFAHVLAGDTLTISTNLYLSGGSGFAKADGGMLVLQGDSTFNGVALQSAVNFSTTMSVNGGTLQLAGGNQTLFQNYEVPASAGNVNLTTTQGQTTGVQFGATLDLNGTNQMLQVLNEGNTTQLTGGSVINSNATTASTLRLDPNGNQTWSGNISGAGAGVVNLVRDGNSTYTINSPQTYTGTTTIEGGVTNLVDLATLQGTSQIDIRRGVLKWDNTGYTAMSNRLTNASSSSNPPIYFDGGALLFNPRSGIADTFNIGNVVLNSGSSIIQVGTNGGSATVNAGTLTRNAGTDITFSNVIGGGSNANNGSFGDNPYLRFSTAPTLVNGMIGGWAVLEGEDIGQGGTATQAAFATYDPATGLRGLESFNEVGAGNAGNVFVLNGNTRLIASQTLPGTLGAATSTTINSLTISAGMTVSFVNSTDTLVLQSGGLLSGTDGNNRNIGQTQGFGNLTTSAGQQELFLHNGASILTINSNITNNGNPVAVVLDGLNIQGPAITLAGNNTYTGTTYVNGVITNLSSLNSGGTAVPGTSLIISGSTNNGTDSMNPANAAVFLQANSQINPAANVTLMGGGEFHLNGFNNTINNLIITNDGGDGTSSAGPVVFSYGTNTTTTAGTAGTMGGAGLLTIAGTISATTAGVSNPNNLANIAQSFGIPTINAQISFSSGTPTIFVDPTNVPGQIGLELNNTVATTGNIAINKTGAGVLGIGGQQTAFTGGINVNAGTLAFGANNTEFGGSLVTLANGAILDTRALTGTIGSLTGTGMVQNYNLTTAGTLQTGYDNTDSTFAGTFVSPFSNGLLNVTKIGLGTFTLTGVSTATNSGTLTVSQGTVALNSTGVVSFTAETLNTGGMLLIDDSASVINNRLGTSFLFPSQTVTTTSSNARAVNFQGGNLTIKGNSSVAVSEGLGNVNIAGGGTLVLSAAGTGGVNATIATMQNQTQNESLLIMGDGLGSSAGANVATLTATTITFRGGTTNTAGSTTLRIREDIIADNSSTDTTFTGAGVGFLTQDTSGTGLRPLNQSTELAPITGTLTTTTNVGVTSAATGAVSTSVNPGTITLLAGGGGVSSGLLPGNPYSAAGTLLNLTLSQGGVLAQAGNNGIAFGQLTNGDTLDVHVLGTGIMNLNAPIFDTNGFIKAESGTLVLQQPYYAANGSQSIAINGGTLQLAAGNNTLFTQPTATIPTVMTLAVNTGVLDLNGNNQLVGNVTSTNPLPYGGGTAASPNIFINNSSAAPANFIANTTLTNTFSGVLENTGGGALSFFKQGAGLLTLTSPGTNTGSTNVQGGSLILQSAGSLANTSAVNVNSATFTLDDSGLQPLANRLGTSAPVNLFGAASLTVIGREGTDNVNINAINVGQGASSFNGNLYNATAQTGVLNVTGTSVAQIPSSPNGTINFVPNAGTFGAVGGNAHLFLTAPTLNNGIIGGWAIVNGADFATYTASQGVGGLASGGNFAGYSGNTLAQGGAANNISVGGSATDTNLVSNAVNSLAIRAPGAVTIVSLANTSEILTIGTGGLLVNDSGNKGVTIASGQITAGTTSSAASVYAYINVNTTTINSQIVNNSTGGAVTLVKSGAGTLTLNPVYALGLNVAATATTQTITVPSTAGIVPTSGSMTIPGATAATYTVASATTITLNYTGTPTAQFDLLTTTATQSSNYTGGAIVNQGTLNLAGAAGTVSIPGNVTVNGGATLTETTNTGQIATTGNVTLNNNAVLNLPTAANTLNSLTFNDNGSSTSLTLTIPASQTLNLTGSSASVITAINNNSGTIPTITGTTATLALGAAPTITTGGIAQESIVLNVPITVASGALTINGTGGAVVLGTLESAANATTFGGGVNLSGTSGIILTGSSTPTTGTVTSGPLGTGTLTIAAGTGSGPILQSASTGPFTLANALAINGPLTLGGTLAANSVALSGPITFSNNPIITVPSNIVTETITSTLAGSGFGKAGPGALTLSPTAASTFTGPVNISGGLVTLGNANAIPSSIVPDLTVGNAAAFNIATFNTTVGALSGGSGTTPGTSGGLIITGASTFTVSPGGASSTQFYGLITGTSTTNTLIKGGNAGSSLSLELSSANWYTGPTSVNAGALYVDGFNTAQMGNYTVAANATLGGGYGLTAAQIAFATTKGISILGGTTGASNPAGGPYVPANGGTFSAGNGRPGIMNISGGAAAPAAGQLVLGNNATYKIYLNGSLPGGSDTFGTNGFSQTIVNSATNASSIALGSGDDLQVIVGPGYTTLTTDYIFDTSNNVSGRFATVNGNVLTQTSVSNVYTATDPNTTFAYTITYNTTDPNRSGTLPGFLSDVSLSVQVPEPASLAMLGLGAIGLLARRRRGNAK